MVFYETLTVHQAEGTPDLSKPSSGTAYTLSNGNTSLPSLLILHQITASPSREFSSSSLFTSAVTVKATSCVFQAPKAATTLYLLNIVTNINVNPNYRMSLLLVWTREEVALQSTLSQDGQGALPWREGGPVCGYRRLAFHFNGDGRTTSIWLCLFGIAAPSPALALVNITLLNEYQSYLCSSWAPFRPVPGPHSPLSNTVYIFIVL